MRPIKKVKGGLEIKSEVWVSPVLENLLGNICWIKTVLRGLAE